MFDNLSQRLGTTIDRLRGKGRITEQNVKDALREVRMALLEADVALPVVKQFIDSVRKRAVGREVLRSLTPGQALVKIVHDELIRVMGEQSEGLNLATRPPAVILMAGLQGSGKTTTVAKLARFLIERQRKRVGVVSCDIYRPAAIEQLATLAEEVSATFFPSSVVQQPVDIAHGAIESARKQHLDVLLVDTAGRLHIDEVMMAEIRQIHAAIEPVETLFVVDAMTGQDAANTASAFNEALPLTGVVLTKTDGDARGGAALSVRQITGKPIKFIGVGEKSDGLEAFHPDRIASRILGMGDVLSLVEQAQTKVDEEKAFKLAQKIQKGKGFDLEDFRDQLGQISGMGDLGGMIEKIPGLSSIPKEMRDKIDANREMKRMLAIINSMTPDERRQPALIKGSRKRRIAAGSGTQVQDVNTMLKQFTQMQKMMKKMKGGGMGRMLRGLGGLGGQLPRGPGGGRFPGM